MLITYSLEVIYTKKVGNVVKMTHLLKLVEWASLVERVDGDRLNLCVDVTDVSEEQSSSIFKAETFG